MAQAMVTFQSPLMLEKAAGIFWTQKKKMHTHTLRCNLRRDVLALRTRFLNFESPCLSCVVEHESRREQRADCRGACLPARPGWRP